MYKEIVISIFIIVLIFAGDFISQKYTKKTVHELTEKLAILRTNLEKENKDESIKMADDIYNRLEQVHNILAYYIEHDELEKMETNFTVCKSLVNTESYSFAISELEKTQYVIDHITDKYSFSLENIF